MVAPSKVASKVVVGLEMLGADIGDLPDLDAEWDTLDEAERVSWSLTWDHVMGTYLPLVDEAYRRGRMTPEQAATYRETLGRLKAALPIIERLRLMPPTVPLDPASAR
jgi:hypothetical protein